MQNSTISNTQRFMERGLSGFLRNLQNLLKKRNNGQGSYAREGEVERKIHQVAQTLQEQFPKASGIKLGKGMLPYVMTGLLLFMPSQFQKAAHAGDIKEGPKLALNTKAPVLPEGSRTSVQPAAHVPAPEREKAPCADMAACSRKEAYRASTNKIVLHYGEGIEDADLLAEGLSERNYPAIAVPGGKPGQVELFVNRGKFGKYNQHDLDSGRLGGNGILFFEKYVRGVDQPELVSSAQ